MDYEKAYKESFEAAKGLHEAGNALTKKQMEIVFPQLAESEDERIRKCIGMALTDVNEQRFNDYGVTLKDCLAWLEKQKEQKPAEINLKALLTADRLASAEMTGRLKERSEILENPDKYGLQKAAEWSEEDEKMLEGTLMWLDDLEKQGEYVEKERLWLKSLRPVSKESLQSWKPSEEQMKALLKVVDKARELHYTSIDGYSGYNDLRSLYEQLKKLM